MEDIVKLALAASVGALTLAGPQSAKAADMAVPQAQYEALPSQTYVPPPAQQSYAYPPPPVVYGYPPPPVAYYAYAPPYVVWPGPYYGRGPYWRGYGPRFAYGYNRWGRGWHRR